MTHGDFDEIHAAIGERLGGGGRRYTRTRRRLTEVILAAGRPLTLPEIVSVAPDLAQSSAYRNLDVLEQAGVVSRISAASGHTRFELAEPLVAHHHHLICIDCGTIEDIRLDQELESLVDETLTAAAAEVGFKPLHHSLDLHGRCTDCEPT